MSSKKPRRKGMTIEEWEIAKKTDPEWLANQEKRERKEKRRLAWAGVLLAHEAPLLADLRAAGFDVETVSDLFNRKEPWRKDIPIPPYPEAIPILIGHLKRPYIFQVRMAIVRALTDPLAPDVFDWLVGELRRTADPQVAAEEKKAAVDLVMNGVGAFCPVEEFHTRDELEGFIAHNWNTYRFVLVNAIVYLFQQEHIPLIVGLIREAAASQEDHFKVLADDIRKKMRRWRRNDPEVLELLDSLTNP